MLHRLRRRCRRPLSAAVSSMSLQTTRPPRRASSAANAAPMPLPAPVMTAAVTPAPLFHPAVGRPKNRAIRTTIDTNARGHTRFKITCGSLGRRSFTGGSLPCLTRSVTQIGSCIQALVGHNLADRLAMHFGVIQFQFRRFWIFRRASGKIAGGRRGLRRWLLAQRPADLARLLVGLASALPQHRRRP